MAIRVRLDGEKELLRKMQQLPRRVAKRVLAKAVRAEARPFVKAARRLAPKRNRIFYRSLELVIRRYQGAVFAAVGQNTAKVIRKRRIKHGGGISGRGDVVPLHLVDQPTRPRRIAPKTRTDGRRGVLRFTVSGSPVFARSVRHPGTRGARFMARAAAAARAEGVSAFASKFATELDREVDRL